MKNVHFTEHNYANKITLHHLEQLYGPDIEPQPSRLIDGTNTDDSKRELNVCSPSHCHGAFDESPQAIIIPSHGNTYQLGRRDNVYGISPTPLLPMVDQVHDGVTKYKVNNLAHMNDSTNLPKGENRNVVATIACKTHQATESQYESTCSMYDMASSMLDLTRYQINTQTIQL
jgi:hypothetical protein